MVNQAEACLPDCSLMIDQSKARLRVSHCRLVINKTEAARWLLAALSIRFLVLDQAQASIVVMEGFFHV